MEGGGQTLNGLKRRTGQRNRRYRRDSEYRPATKCQWRDTPRGDGSPFPQERDRAHRPSYSSVSMETPVSAQRADHLGESGTDGKCEQSFAVEKDLGGVPMASKVECVAVLDTGATANLVRLKWLANHKSHLQKTGLPKVNTYPAAARIKFGDGRIGEVRPAADIQVGIAGRKSTCSAFVLEAAFPFITT